MNVSLFVARIITTRSHLARIIVNADEPSRQTLAARLNDWGGKIMLSPRARRKSHSFVAPHLVVFFKLYRFQRAAADGPRARAMLYFENIPLP